MDRRKRDATHLNGCIPANTSAICIPICSNFDSKALTTSNHEDSHSASSDLAKFYRKPSASKSALCSWHARNSQIDPNVAIEQSRSAKGFIFLKSSTRLTPLQPHPQLAPRFNLKKAPYAWGKVEFLPSTLCLPLMFVLWLILGCVIQIGAGEVVHLRVGALLEESDHEQANMFIRTIKMINERRDETIKQLLNISAAGRSKAKKGPPASAASELDGHRIDKAYDQAMNKSLAPHSRSSRSLSNLSHKQQPRPNRQFDSHSESMSEQRLDSAPRPRFNEDDVDNDDDNNGWRIRAKRLVSGVQEYTPVRLEPMIEFLTDKHNSLEADNKVCQLIESGVRAIFGPSDGSSIQHIRSICDNMEIPYFELRPFLGSIQPAISPAMPGWTHQQHQHQHSSPIFREHDDKVDDYREVYGASGSNFSADRQHHPAKYESGSLHPSITTLLDKRHDRRGRPVEEVVFGAEDRGSQGFVAQSGAINHGEDLMLNLYPAAQILNSAYIDLIDAWNWTSYAIVYEDNESMIKLQGLFLGNSGNWLNRWKISLFRYEPNEAGEIRKMAATNKNDAEQSGSDKTAANETAERTFDLRGGAQSQTSESQANIGADAKTQSKKLTTFRDIFWRIKLSGETNVLLDVKTQNLYEALKQAQQVGCMTEKFSFLITSLDLHTIDLEDFKYSRTKITSLSLLNLASSTSSSSDESDSKLSNDTYNPDQKSRIGRRALDAPASDDKLAAADANHDIAFGEKYLESLGVHVIQQTEQMADTIRLSKGNRKSNGDYHQYSRNYGKTKLPKYKLSPSIVLEKTGQYMDPPNEITREWSRRDMYLSSPMSMSILPVLDRDNEQKLFEFFVSQQDRSLAKVKLSTSIAIMHDSLVLLMLALNDIDPKGSYLGEQSNVACSLGSQPWPHGSSMSNYMKRTSFMGLTGPISFDQRGLRSDFKLDMLGMAPDLGLIKVGEWHSRHVNELIKSEAAPSFGEVRSYDDLSQEYESELKRYKQIMANGGKVVVPYTKSMSRHEALKVNEIIFDRLYREQTDQVDTLVITTKLSQPYFMLKETPNKLDGNDQYEGFVVDFIHELSKLVNFKYRFKRVDDGKYGSKELLPNGTIVWNGIIGEVVRGKADVGIVDLTITAQREEAVDFTLPFMNTGISILFKKPTNKVTTLFSFLSPFSSDVWAYVLAAYCGISGILFFVGHLSPYEWADPHLCRHTSGDDKETVLKNQFSLLNSFWFTIGSLMQQGSDLTPRSMSTRTIAAIWYFFTLIMISSYTANLAAFLTVEKVVYPIENVRDLSNQEEIKYGCVESGSTCTFFHDSQIDTYKRINETMRKFRTYVRSNDEGQKRVEEEKFAFFMESTSIEYIVERNCNLTQIGGLLDSKGYGLALSKKSRLKRPYRTLLSEGILHLQEVGVLHMLKNRWWKERRGGGTCTDDGKGGGVTELSLANVGGVFVVLLGGLGISFLVAIAEFMWRARRGGSTRDRMCEEMMSDLKFALACKRSTKPVNNNATNGRQNNGAFDTAATDRAIRRHLDKQNSSFISQSVNESSGDSMLDFESAAILASQQQTKSCDPILLQAMLTLLMQQRDLQHQQRQIANCVRGEKATFSALDTELCAASYDSHRSLAANHKPMAADYHQPRVNAAAAAAATKSQLSGNKMRPNSNGGHPPPSSHRIAAAAGGYHQRLDDEQLGEHQDGASRSFQMASPQSEATKRRLLFAQTTMDTTTTDDSQMQCLIGPRPTTTTTAMQLLAASNTLNGPERQQHIIVRHGTTKD